MWEFSLEYVCEEIDGKWGCEKMSYKRGDLRKLKRSGDPVLGCMERDKVLNELFKEILVNYEDKDFVKGLMRYLEHFSKAFKNAGVTLNGFCDSATKVVPFVIKIIKLKINYQHELSLLGNMIPDILLDTNLRKVIDIFGEKFFEFHDFILYYLDGVCQQRLFLYLSFPYTNVLQLLYHHKPTQSLECMVLNRIL